MNLLKKMIIADIKANKGTTSCSASYFKLLFKLNQLIGDKRVMSGSAAQINLSKKKIKKIACVALEEYLATSQLVIPYELTNLGPKRRSHIKHVDNPLYDVIPKSELLEIRRTHRKKITFEKVSKQAKITGKSVTTILAQRIDR